MPAGLKLACILVAIILFLLAALPLPTRGYSIGWLGLAFLAAAEAVSA